MPNGDRRDGFFYPTLTLMIDSFIIQRVKTSSYIETITCMSETGFVCALCSRYEGYCFFMLNSTEHAISTAFLKKMLKIKTFLTFKHSDVVLVMLRNVKMTTNFSILTFMNTFNFMVSLFEY